MTLENAIKQIKAGEVVAFPTETVYGLGADARNPDAIRKIFEIKGRPEDNPLIIHLHKQEQVFDFALEISPEAKNLMETCWPGPLTLIFRKKPEVLDMVTSGLVTVALRIPDHPVALELIEQTGPLAAPSANRSGRPSPTRAEHVQRDFGNKVPILDGGEADVGLESTVLDVTQKPFTILRPGKYTAQELKSISGVDVILRTESTDRPDSPGVKYTHYKPEAEVAWFDPGSEPEREKTLLISHTVKPDGYEHQRHYEEDYTALAHDLYDLFRQADLQSLKRVVIEPLPDESTHPLIGALRNRIEKAIG